MEESRNTMAVVLGRQAYRENDSLVSVYTKDFGKLTLVARGAKKPASKLAGHLEPLSLIDLMVIKGKSFDYAGSAIVRRAFLKLKDDLNKIYYAGRVASLFDRLVKENQADPSLFFLFLKWLEAVDDYPVQDFTKEAGELFYLLWAWRLLAELGYQPELRVCLSCRKKVPAGKNHFDLKGGGLLDDACFQAGKQVGHLEVLPLSDNAIRLWRLILSSSLGPVARLKVGKKTIKELSVLTDKFLKYNF